ncbi:hypothetical protein D3C77_401410 [compost metagenome]
MQDDDLVSLPRQRGIEHLACQVATGVRNHHEGLAELASLRLMYGQGVGKLKRRRTFLRVELPRLVLVGDSGL